MWQVGRGGYLNNKLTIVATIDAMEHFSVSCKHKIKLDWL